MNKQEFLHIINQPSAIGEKESEALEDMAKSFPYCQIAHALLAKSAHDKGSMMALQLLKTAAVYSVSRTALKNLIYSESTWYESPSRVLSSVLATMPEDEAEVAKPPVPLPYTEPQGNSLENEISVIAAQWSQAEVTRRERLQSPSLGENEPKPTFDEAPAKPADNRVIDDLKATIEELQRTKLAMAAKQRSQEEMPSSEQDAVSEEDKDAPSVNFSEKPDRVQQIELIDRFIVSNPRMPSAAEIAEIEDEKGDLASESSRINENLVSENLAIILTKQGKINKAIEIYRKLILKYPEKTSYFASRIESLEKIG